MTTTFTILNIVLVSAIFATVVGLLAWAIATQSRDHGTIATGSRENGRQALPRKHGIDRPRTQAGHPLSAQSERPRVQRRHSHGLA